VPASPSTIALTLRRLYWVIDNTIKAIQQESRPSSSRQWTRDRLASRRLEVAMRFARGYEELIKDAPDLLDPSMRSERSANEIRRTSSDISKRWNIITSLQPEDFAAALRESRAGD
jgi:hypothetical protein